MFSIYPSNFAPPPKIYFCIRPGGGGLKRTTVLRMVNEGKINKPERQMRGKKRFKKIFNPFLENQI